MNTEEIYFKKTFISEPPKEDGIYPVIIEGGQHNISWYIKGDWQYAGATHWLQPCSPPDEGAFAKWCSINGWYYILNEGWSQDLREALCSPEKTVFYPDEYVISLFVTRRDGKDSESKSANSENKVVSDSHRQ